MHRARKESLTNFVGVLTTGESAGLVSESAPMADMQLAHAYEKRVAKVRGDGVTIWKCRWHGEPDLETARWIRRTAAPYARRVLACRPLQDHAHPGAEARATDYVV